MCKDQKHIWAQLCGLRLLSGPAELIPGQAPCCIGGIMSRVLADAVGVPEANMSSMCLSKHKHSKQGDSKSLPSAPREHGHKGIWLNTVLEKCFFTARTMASVDYTLFNWDATYTTLFDGEANTAVFSVTLNIMDVWCSEDPERCRGGVQIKSELFISTVKYIGNDIKLKTTDDYWSTRNTRWNIRKELGTNQRWNYQNETGTREHWTKRWRLNEKHWAVGMGIV